MFRHLKEIEGGPNFTQVGHIPNRFLIHAKISVPFHIGLPLRFMSHHRPRENMLFHIGYRHPIMVVLQSV